MLEGIIEIIDKDFNYKNYNSANELEKDIHQYLREKSRQILGYKLQIEIENKEKELILSDSSLEFVNFQRKTIYTIYGEVEIKRRNFKGKGALIDKIMKINDWLSMTEKLASIFSLNETFENSHEEFEEFTGNKISTPTLQKHVEKIGSELSEEIKMDAEKAKEIKLQGTGVLTDIVVKKEPERIIYVGADGTGVPMRTGGTEEAKVGIVFKEEDRMKLTEKRNQIVRRQYVATMADADGFMPLIWSAYLQVAENENYKVVCLGDGAPWIWNRFEELFPERIEILDFFHLSEYVWDVAKVCFEDKTEAENWVSIQLKRLKDSESEQLLNELKFLNKRYRKPSIKDEIKKLETYLGNNKHRIDYKSYLEAGLMIGSGVVESSNKVVVTNRMKQGGMHWSKDGAQAIMSLRALYCSSRAQWNHFWNKKLI